MTTTDTPLGGRPGTTPGAARPRRGTPTVLAAGCGLAAGALTLAVADAVAGLVAPSSSPVLAVGATFIDLTPGWLKDFAISTFGTNDKLVLLGSMAAVIAALSAAAGVVARRHPRAGAALVVALGVVAVLAAVTRPDATALAAVPALVGVLTGVIALLAACAPLRRAGLHPSTTDGDPTADDAADPAGGAPGAGWPMRRRRVLVGIAGTAGAAVVAGGTGRALAARISAGALGPEGVALPIPADRAPAIPGGAQVDVPGATRFVTRNADFYRIDTALVVPRLDASTWKLTVRGQVDRAVELSYRDLLAMPMVERTITLTCVSNEVGGILAGTATWLGVPIADVLQRAGVQAGADMVLSRSSDGYTASTPLSALLDGRDALLAVGMNGAPLPAEHGFPVRMVVPGLYGYVSATKWLVDLDVTRFDRAEAYWTRRGWEPQAPIKTFSRIDVPKPLARVPAGRVAVAGVAWAQHRGVRAVQVRVDGGPWQAARLADEASIDTWRQWLWSWDATPGTHTLEVRSTDGTGATQPQERRPPKPDGATGWHSVVVSVI